MSGCHAKQHGGVDERATWKCSCGKENCCIWGSAAARKKGSKCGRKKSYLQATEYDIQNQAASFAETANMPVSPAQSIRQKLDVVANVLASVVQNDALTYESLRSSHILEAAIVDEKKDYIR